MDENKLIVIPDGYECGRKVIPQIARFLKTKIGKPILIRPDNSGPKWKDIHETRIILGILTGIESRYNSIIKSRHYYMDFCHFPYDLYYGEQRIGNYKIPPLFIPYCASSRNLDNLSSKYIVVSLNAMTELLMIDQPLYDDHIRWLRENLK